METARPALGAGYINTTADMTAETLDTSIPGAYRIDTQTSPFGMAGVIVVTQRSSMSIQVFYSATSSSVVAHRYKGSASAGWSSWVRLDNYGTSSLSELASALGGIKRIDTAPANANNIATNGAYQVSNNVENCNFGWGTLVHIENTYAMQYFFGGPAGTEFTFAARSRLGNGVWRPWYKVSLTEV